MATYNPTVTSIHGLSYQLHTLQLIGPYHGPAWLVAPIGPELTGDHALDELRGTPWEVEDTDIRGWQSANAIIAAYPFGPDQPATYYLATLDPTGDRNPDICGFCGADPCECGDDAPFTNADRAQRAADSIRAATFFDFESAADCIADMLTDFMHLADRDGFDFCQVLARATAHHAAEVQEEHAS